MFWLLLLMWSCGSSPSEDEVRLPVQAQDLAARRQAAHAAPHAQAPWSGAWTVSVWAQDPSAQGPAALGASLAQPVQVWDGTRPSPKPGEVAVVWVKGDTPVPELMDRLAQHRPGFVPGAVVVVLGPGSQAWREAAAGELPWLQLGLVDPLGHLGMYIDNRSTPDHALLGEIAGMRTAEHFKLQRAASTRVLPPVLVPHLGAEPLDAATQSDPRVRAEAIRVGLPANAAQFKSDPQVIVRLAVATVTDDSRVLVSLAQDPEPLVRARAVDRVSDPTVLGKAAADDSSVVRQVAMHRISSLAVRGLWKGRERAIEIGVASEDGYLRWKAAWGLSAGGRRAVGQLIALLRDSDVDVRRQAARSLGRRGGADAHGPLVEATKDANSFVRRSALLALGQVGEPAAKAVLQAALTDPTMLNAEAAWLGLSAMGVEPGVPQPRFEPPEPFQTVAEARSMLNSPDATLRKDLSKYLAGRAELDGGPVLPWLEHLAADPDSEVRKGAIEAMGWGQGTGSAIEAHLDDPDNDCVITALEGLRRSGEGTVKGIAPLLKAKDQEVRLRAAEALAQSADPGAAALLAPLMGDRDERIRAAVVNRLPKTISRDEPSVLVLRAAARTGQVPWLEKHPDLMVQWAWPGADLNGMAYARGVISREDDLLHARFSWNAPKDRPAAYSALRPTMVRPYGHPDRG